MILECRNTHYNKISQILNDLLATYNKKVSIGSSCNCLEAKIILFTNVKKLLACYRPYLEELTYLYSLVVVRGDSSNVTYTLNIGSDSFVYTGAGNAYTITLDLLAQINASTDYKAYLSGTTLYIYSYSTSVNWAETTTVTSTVPTTTGVLTNLQDNTNILIDLWNCLTTKEMCQLINSVYELQPEC